MRLKDVGCFSLGAWIALLAGGTSMGMIAYLNTPPSEGHRERYEKLMKASVVIDNEGRFTFMVVDCQPADDTAMFRVVLRRSDGQLLPAVANRPLEENLVVQVSQIQHAATMGGFTITTFVK